VTVSVRFQANFTICNENTMDVFHGILYQGLQGWCDILPTLTLWNAGFPTSQLGIPAPRHLSRS
jgi:hypothetical protein